MLEKVEIINRFLSNIMIKGYSPSFFFFFLWCLQGVCDVKNPQVISGINFRPNQKWIHYFGTPELVSVT